MKIPVYNSEGTETSQALLPKEIFDVTVNADLLHQAIVAQMGNRRRIIAHTKTRSEVRGGGRKPWKQKGTGRARHGSTRSPIWRKGGITFGPRNDINFKQIMSKPLKRKALFMALSSKAKDNEIIILESLKVEQNKTKAFSALIETIKSKILKQDKSPKNNILVIFGDKEINLARIAKNIKGIETTEARNINALDLIRYKYIVMSKEAIKIIDKIFSGK